MGNSIGEETSSSQHIKTGANILEVALDRRRTSEERLAAIEVIAGTLNDHTNRTALEALLTDFCDPVRDKARAALFQNSSALLREQANKSGDASLQRDIRELLANDTPKSVVVVMLGDLYQRASELATLAFKTLSLSAEPELAHLAKRYHDALAPRNKAA